MSSQINLFPDAPDPAAASPDTASARREKGSAPPAIWLQRTSSCIFVIFCVYLGLVLAVLPWWTSVWDHNVLLQSSPGVWAVMRNGFVRGLVSGFGLLDVWIGISEAVHYRDYRG